MLKDAARLRHAGYILAAGHAVFSHHSKLAGKNVADELGAEQIECTGRAEVKVVTQRDKRDAGGVEVGQCVDKVRNRPAKSDNLQDEQNCVLPSNHAGRGAERGRMANRAKLVGMTRR